jgi:predicted nucleic acid-binding protein
MLSDSLVLIDTSVWILALRKSPLASVKDEVEHLLVENKVAITPMIRMELLGGTKSLNEFNRLKSRLDALHRIPASEANWELATQLSFKLRQQGKVIPYTDILIGAAAITTDCLLLHADRHFDLMAEDTVLNVRSLVSIIVLKRAEGEG